MPASKIKEVLNEFLNGASGRHLGLTKTLEKLKNVFIELDVSCIYTTFERIALGVAGPFLSVMPETDKFPS